MTLRPGDRSHAVRELQKQLNAQGASLLVDSHYGKRTEAAVRAYQASKGLVIDGVVGGKTQHSLKGGDCSQLLAQADLIKAAQRLELPLPTVRAVNEVESRGSGFLDNGKPVILFERHIMHRQLATPRSPGDQPNTLVQHADDLAARYPDLVNRKPGGYSGGTAEHQRLTQARLIDDRAALESTSWGAFQIMGLHWQRLGFDSVQAYARAMQHSEAAQCEAFTRFIETDPTLHAALRQRKWALFARHYNGPDYARNLYDTRLKRAYDRYASCAAPS